MNRTAKTLGLLLLATGLAAWWVWREDGPRVAGTDNDPGRNPQSVRPVSGRSGAEANPAARGWDPARPPAVWRTDVVAGQLAQAASLLERFRLLGELRDPRYPRLEAIRVIEPYLNDPDLTVRLQAAELLYQLGSPAAHDFLLALLREAASNTTIPVDSGIQAAGILNRYREQIPADVLIGFQLRSGYPGVTGIMAMQGDPRFAPYVLSAVRTEAIAGNLFDLGLLASPEGQPLALDIYEHTGNETTKVAAAWALFRLTGERSPLDYVLGVADHLVTDRNGIQGVAPGAAQYAFREIAVTKDEAAVTFLHRAALESNFGEIRSAAVASLFYVHQDFEFVDDYISRYFVGPTAAENVDGELCRRIAAARAVPAITALAQRQNPDAYYREFVQLAGRPVESWIWNYLSHVPSSRLGAR